MELFLGLLFDTADFIPWDDDMDFWIKSARLTSKLIDILKKNLEKNII